MSSPALVALTGGPGGGKDTLIRELLSDPRWDGLVASLPEAITLAGGIAFSLSEQGFQKEIVRLQRQQEDSLLGPSREGHALIILCNRGTLDSLAYWLDRGWEAEEFFTLTDSTRDEHYRRYRAVIHLVTSADGAEDAYRSWPAAHRPESKEHAIRLDRLLEQAWKGHPHYYRVANSGNGWAEKSARARRILEELWVTHVA